MRLDVPDRHVPLDMINLLDPEQFRTGLPTASLATLQDRAPVWRHDTSNGAGFWCVTRYDDVWEVLRDDRRYTSEQGTILDVLDGDPAGGKTINLMDRPKHTWIREPTMRTMTVRQIDEHTDAIRSRLRELLAPCLTGELVDFAERIRPLAMTALGDVMGIPRESWHDVARWAMAGVAPTDPAFSTGSAASTLGVVHHSLFAILGSLIRERRARPGSDLISVLLDLDFGGRPLPQELVLLNCYSFLMGANTTTPHVASHLVLVLAERGDVWRAVSDDRALIESTVEEALRWATPTNHLMRRAKAPLTIGDVRIGGGEAVSAWLAAGNRDGRVFQDACEFEPRRSPNPHVAFGVGPHYCVGAPIARLVLALLLDELVTHVERIELRGEPTHLASNFINGITHLPVVFHPRRASAVR